MSTNLHCSFNKAVPHQDFFKPLTLMILEIIWGNIKTKFRVDIFRQHFFHSTALTFSTDPVRKQCRHS